MEFIRAAQGTGQVGAYLQPVMAFFAIAIVTMTFIALGIFFPIHGVETRDALDLGGVHRSQSICNLASSRRRVSPAVFLLRDVQQSASPLSA